MPFCALLLTSFPNLDRCVWVSQQKRGAWNVLPFELLDGVKALLEQLEGSGDVVVQTIARLRLVNKHWCLWATRATTILKPHLSHSPWTSVVQKFVNINTIIFKPRFMVTDYLLDKLCQFSSLTSLHFDGDSQLTIGYYKHYFTDIGRGCLGRMTTLRDLSLWGPRPDKTNDEIENLTSLTALTRLSLDLDPTLGDEGLRSLANLITLKELDLKAHYEWRTTDRGFQHMTRLTSLTRLHLKSFNTILDEGARSLASLIALKDLDFEYCSRITDAGLQHFTSLTSLTRLCLRNLSEITDESAISLASLIALKDLDLGFCKITDVGLQHMMSLTSLTKLCLQYCEKIRDEGASSLASLIALKDLNLGYCKEITDVALQHLTSLTSLTRLSLEDCGKITNEGANSLASSLALKVIR